MKIPETKKGKMNQSKKKVKIENKDSLMKRRERPCFFSSRLPRFPDFLTLAVTLYTRNKRDLILKIVQSFDNKTSCIYSIRFIKEAI